MRRGAGVPPAVAQAFLRCAEDRLCPCAGAGRSRNRGRDARATTRGGTGMPPIGVNLRSPRPSKPVSRRAAECGPWRKPWDKADTGHSTAFAVGHSLSALRACESSSEKGHANGAKLRSAAMGISLALGRDAPATAAGTAARRRDGGGILPAQSHGRMAVPQQSEGLLPRGLTVSPGQPTIIMAKCYA